MTPSPLEFDIDKVLRKFLLDVLDDVEVIKGQANRVPSPTKPNYLVFWPLARPRLSTNVNTSADTKFVGSIALDVLTVTAMDLGTIRTGSRLYGVGVAANTTVGAQLSVVGLPGGLGTYSVSPSQSVASTTLSSGGTDHMAPTQVDVQVDVHGPNSANNAQVISTLMRDGYGVEKFQEQGYDIWPLHADDPKQIPFTTGEDQYEDRWVVTALLQANIVVRTPQQYADSINILTVEVDTTFPANPAPIIMP